MESDDEDFVGYRTKHTTETGLVKYYRDFLEEEGINYGGKNEAVRTCRKMRCAEKERGDRLPKVRNRAPTPFAR
ncbi:hypothetical protein FS749_011306 [Ceratobasidium sp. UAMH 11750]|nr:hypothetical protein FS749_011306 [Ceratobasidium sp. UAMH 11750]